MIQELSRNMILTDRDFLILKGLYDNTVTGFYQIHQKYFTGKSHSTVMNRLKLLEENNYILRHRIPRMSALIEKREIGVVFQVTGRGTQVLRNKFPGEIFSDKVPSISPQSLSHDLLLNDIKDAICGEHPGFEWMNGKYLVYNQGFRKIPDAVLKMSNQEGFIAIELELIVKSSSRYRQIIAEFRSSREIKKVIYITANHHIDQKIMSELEGYQVPLGHKTSGNFFEFKSLNEVLKIHEEHQQRVKQ